MKIRRKLLLLPALVAGLGLILAGRVTAQSFTVLHTFTSASGPNATNTDGANPFAGLMLSGNTLFGAANDGGRSGHGTVFAVTTNGSAFTTLHSFSSGSGGAYASAGLILSGDTLYGTDYGNLGNGTVFAI